MTNDTRTVVALFENMGDAERAIEALERAGVPSGDINLLAGNESGRYNKWDRADLDPSNTAKGVTAGAGAGAAIGGGLGLIAGLTALAVPGFGPILAAGPIAAVLAGAGIGAAAGGLVGGLTNSGVPREDAEYYAEGVRRGGVLVTVQTPEEAAERVAATLDDFGAVDVEDKSRHWFESGWAGPSGSTLAAVDTEKVDSGHRAQIERELHSKRGRSSRVYSHEHHQPQPAGIRDFEPFRESEFDLEDAFDRSRRKR